LTGLRLDSSRSGEELCGTSSSSKEDSGAGALTCPISPDVSRRAHPETKSSSSSKEAIEFHIEGLKEEGLPAPEPLSESELVDVTAA
jgi:hypothetical protein